MYDCQIPFRAIPIAISYESLSVCAAAHMRSRCPLYWLKLGISSRCWTICGRVSGGQRGRKQALRIFCSIFARNFSSKRTYVAASPVLMSSSTDILSREGGVMLVSAEVFCDSLGCWASVVLLESDGGIWRVNDESFGKDSFLVWLSAFCD